MIEILKSPRDEPPASAARAAIVTLVIGELYERTWTGVCAGSWVNYARRADLDIVVLNFRIDPDDARSPAWQKLLILDLPWTRRYERIIWLDSDIVINESAPNILDHAGPVEKVGVCEEGGRLSPAEAQVYLEGESKPKLSPDDVLTSWRTFTRERYIGHNLPPHDVMFNTGVIVLSPAHHSETLKRVYAAPEISRLYEQPQLSHGLLDDGLAHVLSPRFNWGILELYALIFKNGALGDETPEFKAQILHLIVRSQLKAAYFLHFYGAMSLLAHYADRLRPPAPAAAE